MNMRLKEIEKKSSYMKDKIIDLGLQYTNKIGGFSTPETNKFYLLRDSFSHRINSILFHYELLSRKEITIPKYQDEHYKNTGSDGFIIGEYLTQHVTYIFEDLIFNLISLLDYLGNIISQIIDQGSIDDWSGICKAAQPKSNNPLKDMSISKHILELHNELTNNKLDKYRNALIHRKAFFANVKQSFVIGSSKTGHEIQILAPSFFIKRFKELKELKKEENEITLRYTVNWITEKCFHHVKDVLDNLDQTIEEMRKISVEDEPIKFKKP